MAAKCSLTETIRWLFFDMFLFFTVYSENHILTLLWTTSYFIKVFLCDSFMLFSSSHSPFLMFNSVIQDSFQHFSVTFDLAWDFIL